MDTVDVVLGIILLVAAVFLIVAVLMQSGKSHRLSGTIAGGADTFFGKTKGKTIDRMLSKITAVVAVIFALLVIAVYVIQDDTFVTKDNYIDDYISGLGDDSEAAGETGAESGSTETSADSGTDNETADTADSLETAE
ncbi:MAG: preprotein translocase subunit SecG [Clostridia bacterium]|nr:preprotein translocase subunit SecG [Clostridia bacterium]